MAQHDYVIANGTGAAVRSDLNNALAAIVSQNSGATEPATMYAYQWWADTTTGLLKLRNGANNAWITLRELDGTLTIEDGTASSPGLAFADDLNTGVFSPGADQVAFTAGGTARLTATTTGITSALPVDVPLGSASAPTVTFTGDLNTGIYSPGADQVAVATNGTGRLFVNSTGLVGIGTSAPNCLLEVKGGSAITSLANSYANCGFLHQYSVSTLLAIGNDGTSPVLQGVNATSNTARNLLLNPLGGSVGIGTASPAALLDVYKGSGSSYVDSILLSNTLGNGANQGIAWGSVTNISGRIKGLDDGASGTHLIFENRTGGPSTTTTERGRWTSDGKFLVGTSSATAVTDGNVSAQLEVEGTTTATSAISIIRNSNDTNAGGLIIAKSRGTAAGSNTLVSSGDTLGFIQFQGADGTQKRIGASIDAVADAATGSNDLPTRLTFSTCPDSGSSPVERMRITNGGQFLFNCTSQPSSTVKGSAILLNGSAGNYYASGCNVTTACAHLEFYNPNGSVGSIQTSSSSTSYITSSDYRLKENVEPVADGINRLQQLKPSRFNFIADPDKTVDGFIAHEVQAVVPEAIIGEKDAVDDDGNPVYQGIDQSKLVPLLTSALQELVAEVEILKAEVAALKTP